MFKIFILILIILQTFYSFDNFDGSDCATEEWDGCICENEKCVACNKEDYHYVYVDSNLDLSHCCHQSCQVCNENQNGQNCFILCSQGYFFDFTQFNCFKCDDQCLECSNSSTECTECALNSDINSADFVPGFVGVYNSDTNLCELQPCPEHCDYCYLDNDNIKCSVCKRYWNEERQVYDAYYVNYIHECSPCPENCEFCEMDRNARFDPIQCRECANSDIINYYSAEDAINKDQYYIDLYNFYYGDTHNDHQFSQIYYLNQDNECAPCPQNCLDCEYNLGIQCISCKTQSEYINSNFECQQCPENCKICDYNKLNDEVTCITCQEGFDTFNTSICQSCPQNCSECRLHQNQIQCTKCSLISLYIDQSNYRCTECPSHCLSCQYNELLQDIECILCASDLQDPQYKCCPIGCKKCEYQGDKQVCLECTDARRFNDPQNQCEDVSKIEPKEIAEENNTLEILAIVLIVIVVIFLVVTSILCFIVYRQKQQIFDQQNVKYSKQATNITGTLQDLGVVGNRQIEIERNDEKQHNITFQAAADNTSQ